MIIIDTSALAAIFFDEEDAAFYSRILHESEDLVLPASCYLESVLALRRHANPRPWLDATILQFSIEIAPVTARTTRLAADAFERYGRGTGHPARLNFGDCLAYAAARELDAPLLFKGDDFRRTDVRPAVQADLDRA